jgi:type III secretory pathway component EscV
MKSADELQKNQMERALARDKGVEITELRAKQATISELNDEMLRKLQEEKNKFDKLKYEHIVLTEKLTEMNITLKDDIEYNKQTEANMKAL